MTDNLNNLTAVCSFLHSWLRLAGCGALDGDFWGTRAGLGWAEVGKGESWNRIWMLFCLLGLIPSHLISFHRDLFLSVSLFSACLDFGPWWFSLSLGKGRVTAWAEAGMCVCVLGLFERERLLFQCSLLKSW